MEEFTHRIQFIRQGGEPFAPAELATFEVGASVTCLAEIACPRGFRCNRVRLRVLVRAHGAGSTDEIPVAEQTLHEGNLAPGTSLEGRLTIGIPLEGPMSHSGQYVKIDWLAQLYVDIPWGFDRTWESAFRVNPSKTEPSRRPEEPEATGPAPDEPKPVEEPTQEATTGTRLEACPGSSNTPPGVLPAPHTEAPALSEPPPKESPTSPDTEPVTPALTPEAIEAAAQEEKRKQDKALEEVDDFDD